MFSAGCFRFTQAVFLALLTPVLASAQSFNPYYFETFFGRLTILLADRIVPLLFALALLLFIWGAIRYFIWSGGDERAREEGRKFMLYGIIGLVIIVGVWGIVQLILFMLGLSPGTYTTPDLPALPSISE